MEKIYYSIAEVAEKFDVKQSLLRYWEKEFAQLKPKRNDKGTRFYTAADIAVIEQIRFLLEVQKLTIAGARERLKNNQNDIERKQQLRERLLKLRKQLVDIRRELNQHEAFAEEIVIQ